MSGRQFAYTVRGHWPFPVDMLRHDGSAAAGDEDQALINRLSGEYAPDRDAFQDVDIRLVGPYKPNTARWESFSWAVPDDWEHAQHKRWRAEAAERERHFQSGMAKLTDDERRAIKFRMGGAS